MNFKLRFCGGVDIDQTVRIESDETTDNESDKKERNPFVVVNKLYKLAEQKCGLPRNQFKLSCRSSSNSQLKLTQLDGLGEAEADELLVSTNNNSPTIIHVTPLVLGGKGGFGSLLRAFGKQITLSSNKEACRDLTGRRIRHVNNEEKLRSFMMRQREIAQQKEKEAEEKAERRRKKKARLEQHGGDGTGKVHLFLDPKYDKQKEKISQDVDNAIKLVSDKRRKEKLERKRKLKRMKERDEEEKNHEEQAEEELDEDKEKKEAKETVVVAATVVDEQTAEKIARTTVVGATVVTSRAGKEKFKDWMGVGDQDVSAGSSSSEEEVAPKKMKKIAR